jgi:hypothetical protein
MGIQRMKCKKCETDLIKRKGKFGEFYCCPKSNPSDNHGTISVGQQAYNTASRVSDSLTLAIERQTMALGGGYLTDIVRFVEGGQLAAIDDEDHWMNTRMY